MNSEARERFGKDVTVEVDGATEQEWSQMLDLFADASVYQTWSYGEVSWGRKQLSHIVLKRGTEVLGMAQLRIVQAPVLRRGIAQLRWGPLWRRKGQPHDPEILSQLLDAIHREYARGRKLLLRIIPNVFGGDATEPLIASSFGRVGLKLATDGYSYRTFILDLSPGLEQLRKNLDGKWRNQLNRSEKNNLTVLEGSDQRLYGMFKAIYQEMMDRKAFDTTVDINDFERIQQALGDSQKMHILVALKDEKPVSALVGSTIGETGIYLLGATSNEGMQQKGSYLLQWRMIQRLKERGCGYYDLGGINPETNPGVYHFKSGFSAQDKRQIGQFDVSGHWLSSLIVNMGERRRKKRSAGKAGGHEAPNRPPPAVLNPSLQES